MKGKNIYLSDAEMVIIIEAMDMLLTQYTDKQALPVMARNLQRKILRNKDRRG